MATTTYRHTRRVTPPSRVLAAVPAIIFAVAALVRFWQIGSKPGWEWDEPSYAAIGGNVARHGAVQAVTEYGEHAVTFLYHPPFYFLLLGGWFKAVGIGVTQARVLSAITALIALTLMYFLAKRVIGHKPALVLFAFLAIDPWLIYANRTSWMENSQIVLIVLAMALYWRATQRVTTSAFVVAGFGIGAAVIYKHTAMYLLLAVGVHLLITRTNVMKHLALLAGVVATVATYLVTMSIIFGGLFWHTTAHQWLRTVGSSSVNKSGNGTIHGVSGLIGPIFGQYRVFAATLIVMAAACIWWLFRLGQAAKNRSWSNVRGNAFAFAWMTGGVVGFAAISMKFPSYFQIILIAMYFYLATELTAVFRDNQGVLRRVLAGILAVLAMLSLAGYQWRILGHNDNAMAGVRQYAAASIPQDDVVLTEQPIGQMIKQPFCDIRAHAHKCGAAAKWVITYSSRNYPGADNADARRILANATEVWSKSGFKETIKVYRVNGNLAAG